MNFPGHPNIAGLHSELIKEDVERILSFVCLFLEPRSDEEPPLFKTPAGNLRSYYYVMITIWYLVHKGIQLSAGMTASLKRSGSRLSEVLPPDNYHFSQDENGETLLLKWYYYGSIAKLVGKGFLDDSWCGDGLNHKGLSDKVRRLRRATKMALAAAISSKRPYLPSDEIIDRLAFLESELGLEHHRVDIRFLAANRILQREYT